MDHDNQEPAAKRKTGNEGKATRKVHKLDFSNLPSINNNGLRYLPKMQYFPVESDCPLQPMNVLEQPSLNVIITLPNGGFNCVALPLAAVEKDKANV